MKKAIMKKWVKALRSGDYGQGRARLVTIEHNGSERFCCLGVLCNIATEAGYGEWNGTRFQDENGYNCGGVLTPGVISWAGLTGIHTAIKNPLILLNDRDRKSFAEIADYIEENYKTL